MNEPTWFRDAIISGLQELSVLRLKGSPSSETVTATANVWIKALALRPIVWTKDQDLPRIARAFAHLLSTVREWPSPAMLMEALPPRPEPLSLTAPMSRGMSPENRAALDALKAKLKKSTMPREENHAHHRD